MDMNDITTKEQGDEYKRTLDRYSDTPRIEKLVENAAKGIYQFIPTTHYKPDGYNKSLDEGREDFSVVIKLRNENKLLMDDLLYDTNHSWQDLFPVTAYNLMELPEYEDTGYTLFALGKHPEIMQQECSSRELVEHLYEAVTTDFESLQPQQATTEELADFLREAKGLSAAAKEYGIESIPPSMEQWKSELEHQNPYEMMRAESAVSEDRRNTLYETVALQYDRREFTGNWKNLNNDFENTRGAIPQPNSVELAVYHTENVYYDALQKIGEQSGMELRNAMLVAGISAVVLDAAKNSQDYEQHVKDGNYCEKDGLSKYFIRDENRDYAGLLLDTLDGLNMDMDTRALAEEIALYVHSGAKDFMDHFHDEFVQMHGNPQIDSLVTAIKPLCEMKAETPDIQETLFALKESGHNVGYINGAVSIDALLDQKAESLVSEIRLNTDYDGMLVCSQEKARTMVTELAETLEMANKYVDLRTININDAKKTLYDLSQEGAHPGNTGMEKPDGQLMAERTAARYMQHGIRSLDKGCIREDTARVLNTVEKCAEVAYPDKAPSHAGENFGIAFEQRQAQSQIRDQPQQKKQYEYAD